jgi:hypothetical protein
LMPNLLRRFLMVFGNNDNIICIISNIFKFFYYECTPVIDVLATCALNFCKIRRALHFCMELYIYVYNMTPYPVGRPEFESNAFEIGRTDRVEI